MKLLELNLEINILKNFKLKLSKNLVLCYSDYSYESTVHSSNGSEIVQHTRKNWTIYGTKKTLKGIECNNAHVGKIKPNLSIDDLSYKQKMALMCILLGDPYSSIFKYDLVSKVDNFKSMLNDFVKYIDSPDDYIFKLSDNETEKYFDSLNIDDEEILNKIKGSEYTRDFYRKYIKKVNNEMDFNNDVVDLVKEHGLEKVKEEYLKQTPGTIAYNFAELFSIIYDIKFNKSDYILKSWHCGMTWDLDLLLSADPEYFEQVYERLGNYRILFHNKISVEETLDILKKSKSYLEIKHRMYGNYNTDYEGDESSFNMSLYDTFIYHFEKGNLEITKLLFRIKKLREKIDDHLCEEDKEQFSSILHIKKPKNGILKVGDRKMKVSKVIFVKEGKYKIKGNVDNIKTDLTFNDYNCEIMNQMRIKN